MALLASLSGRRDLGDGYVDNVAGLAIEQLLSTTSLAIVGGVIKQLSSPRFVHQPLKQTVGLRCALQPGISPLVFVSLAMRCEHMLGSYRSVTSCL